MQNIRSVFLGLVLSALLPLSAFAVSDSIGRINITTATVDAPVTITSTIYNLPTVSSCVLVVNGGYTSASTTIAGDKTSVTASYTYRAVGITPTSFTCITSNGNNYVGPATDVEVGSAAAPAGIVGPVNSDTAYYGEAKTFTASLSNLTDASSCVLSVNGNYTSAVTTLASDKSSVSASYTYYNVGSAPTFFTCVTPGGTNYSGTPVAVSVTNRPVVGSVGAINASSAYYGEAKTVTASLSNLADVSSCVLSVNGNYTSAVTTLASDKSSVSASYTYYNVGSAPTFFTCVTPGGTNYSGAPVSVAVTNRPVTGSVGAIKFSTANTGEARTVNANLTNLSDVSSCALSVNGVLSSVATTIASDKSSVSANYTYNSAGTIPTFFTCVTGSGATYSGSPVNVVVTSASVVDTTGPVITMEWPASITAETAFNVTAHADDTSLINNCALSVDGGSYNMMAWAMGNAYLSRLTIATTGTHTLRVRCTDMLQNTNTVAQIYTVAAATTVPTTPTTPVVTVDSVAPRVSTVTPLFVTRGVSTTLYATVTDNVGVTSCKLYIGSNNIGSMTVNGSTASRTYAFAADGPERAYVSCTDAAGNIGYGTQTTITVEKPVTVVPPPTTTRDYVAPSIGYLTPTSTIVNTPTTFSASVADAGGLAWCRLYVQERLASEMRIADGQASASYTFETGGTQKVHIKCADLAGNESRGNSETQVAVTTLIDGGKLVKLQCPNGVKVNHPCTTVFFWGADGTRHPFPHEKVFYSWYKDFSSVETISTELMQSIPLGGNVTYRPGTKLVKFQTDNRVFIVERNGELRPILSEAVARYLAGNNWNKSVEDIGDVFYRDYKIGETLKDSRDWDAKGARESVKSPMDNL